MIFPLQITVGEIRKLIADMPDHAPLCMQYGEVYTDLFARIDGLRAEAPGKLNMIDADTGKEWVEDYPYPCPVLTISLVDGEDEDAESWNDEDNSPECGDHCPDEGCPGVIGDGGECSHCGFGYVDEEDD
jgi:hypothetical protein